MILFPAIDIRGGQAVRLLRGDYERETAYDADPVDAARRWAGEGAQYLHVVDLDGARDGAPANLDHLERITSELEVPVQYGGGLRSLRSVRAALAAGAARVVVGTAAYNDPEFLQTALETWRQRILIAIDVRDGHVSVSGWTEATKLRPEELIERLQQQGATRFVYTNADRDGMLEGVDVDEVRRISAAVRGRFIWSGGIGSAADLEVLRDLRLVNIAGVISGKALYEHRFTVAEGRAALEAKPAPRAV